MKALEKEYNEMRRHYWGMSLPDDSSFDVELVSNIISKLKRGKAVDPFGLSAEHLLFCHPVISVLLSKLFNLMMSTGYIPAGFKYSYIVRVSKPKDCRTKAMTCDDFRAIAISLRCLSTVFCVDFSVCLKLLIISSASRKESAVVMLYAVYIILSNKLLLTAVLSTYVR